MNGLALCAGVGGLEIGVKMALGACYRCVGYVEREGYAAADLVGRMGDKALDQAPIWDDIKTFDSRPWRGVVDLISAGYPCQPFSVAGSQKGKDDPRHLWPDVGRIIEEIKPEWVFLENVPGHRRLGFDQVLGDLAEMGFDAEWCHLSAAALGASHGRERLFCLAHADASGSGEDRKAKAGKSHATVEGKELAHSKSRGRGELWQSPEERGRQPDRKDKALDDALRFPGGERPGRERILEIASSLADPKDADGRGGGKTIPEEAQGRRRRFGGLSPFPPRPDDLDAWARVLEVVPEVEPTFCGVADGVAYRMDRLRACGNGVFPLQAAVALVELSRRMSLML